MAISQAAQAMVYVDSSLNTVVEAVAGTYYVVDTAFAAVVIQLPPGAALGEVITVKNAPNNGAQMGGSVPGNNLTITTTSPEVFDDGSTSQGLGPPATLITAAARTYYPTGPGAQAGFNGWVH